MENETPIESKTPPAPKAGEMVRDARQSTGKELSKICADLRISVAALEALEACQYDRLPGDPYVRALLGSVGRYLHLDPQKLIQAYNAELGSNADVPTVTPYKDLSQTHVMAHKQIFILLLVVLLFALLLLLSRLNSPKQKSDANLDRSNSHITVVQPPTDSIPESLSLLPEPALDSNNVVTSTIISVDSTQIIPRKPDTLLKPHALSPTPTQVLVKPLQDSVWIRIQRFGQPETVELLVLGKKLEVTHSDTISLILGKKKSVELTFADTTLIPVKKRFKIVGKHIRYF